MSLRLHPDVSTADTADGTVLLHQRTGRYWQLNTTGAFVLRQLLNGQATEQVAESLAARHQIDPQQARHDIDAVLEHLRHAQLVIDSP